ncbi:hypothetical protein Mesau_05897 [Mesorhizobium australicum WSM2073]|uniref:Uncharacterized protein n=3 Tax=Mesorhizobium TaxID=68287 RepID=L0KVW6_MESAW|nr:hypothetical protein Mesci_5850 [Mesorhizobium ciceri biovar biserrulae WSM1271]AEH90759.1 hypothetical protein Mesop_6424 [Mesorhizobium opportunistum WSM2075]AGB48129.1 hypothetical protein Mesau_05897 [Mesorhizobium australicum WSM2073]
MGYKPTRHKPREAALIRWIINGFGTQRRRRW